MKTNTDNILDLDVLINQTTDLVSQQEMFLTNILVVDIDELVGEVSSLMSLPEIYLKIRKLMDDPDSSLEDFADVVNTDPGLLALVLKIVNSAYYGFSGQIDNIKRALNLIGIGQLHDLVLSLSALNSLDLSNDIETLQQFWQRSIYCGVLSRLLAKKLKLEDAESLFIIGLLHEVGHLILFVKYPQESRLSVNQAQKENISLLGVERRNFGTDYGKVGQALMAEWKLPLKFQSIIGHQLEPDNATEFIQETAIVHIAHQASVNKYPGADSFRYEMDEDLLLTINTTEEELNDLYEAANDISREMERLIFG